MSHDLACSINRYYQDTAWDYKHLWMGRTLAIHFGYYDQSTKKHKDALLKMNAILADRAGIKEGEKILDAGCGVGGSTIWLAKYKKCLVTGVNIVEHQIEEAKMNARRT